MHASNRTDFIAALREYPLDTQYLIVKPNWVSNVIGEYTEPQILDWLFDAYPNQKKIVIESYTLERA